MNISSILLILSPIYVKPGQCILVGSQEVCALQAESAQTATSSLPTVLHTCSYGNLDHPENHGATKGWRRLMIRVKEDGTKIETIMKSYGPLDEHRKECENEIKKVRLP